MLEVGIAATVVVIVALVFYVRHVSTQVSTAASLMDKSNLLANARGTWAKLDAKLLGWKTVILAWAAGGVQALHYLTTDVVTEWRDLPWTQVFDAKVANGITLVCAFLIPIVHAQGLIKAAKATPGSDIAS